MAKASRTHNPNRNVSVTSEYHRGEREARRMFAEFGGEELLPGDLDYLRRQVRVSERLQDAAAVTELTRAFHRGFVAYAAPRLN